MNQCSNHVQFLYANLYGCLSVKYQFLSQWARGPCFDPVDDGNATKFWTLLFI